MTRVAYRGPMRRAALAIDIVAVLVFVVIGRGSHHHGESLHGIASTAWPFLAGLGVGWVALLARGRPGGGWRDGLVPWLATVAGGMVLRVIAGQGTAAAFVVVALCFLGATMLGGRLLAGALAVRAPARRRA